MESRAPLRMVKVIRIADAAGCSIRSACSSEPSLPYGSLRHAFLPGVTLVDQRILQPTQRNGWMREPMRRSGVPTVRNWDWPELRARLDHSLAQRLKLILSKIAVQALRAWNADHA